MLRDAHLADTARSLTKDMLVTLTDETGTGYEGKIASVNTHAGEDDITTVHVRDTDTYDNVVTLTITPSGDLRLRPATQSGRADAVRCTDIKPGEVRVDWDEPVRYESGLTYVVDCPECGGLMSRNGQHWRRSRESYGCHDCGYEDSWRRADDAVRKPTRHEWAVHKLTNPSPFVSIADRYIPDGYELPGYYFRESCDNDPAHYTRSRVSETGSADYGQFDNLKLGTCPECGAETTSRTRTYDAGVAEWGEPENHGGLPEDFSAALDVVRRLDKDLYIPCEPDDENWGYAYEGVRYLCPWPTDYEDGLLITLDEDGDLYCDIINMGGIKISGGSYGKDLGTLAWWFKHADGAEFRDRK